MVDRAGIEPAASAMSQRRSTGLSYRSTVLVDAASFGEATSGFSSQRSYALSYASVIGGQGTDSNLRTPKGRELQSRCFSHLHTCPLFRGLISWDR
jgi:hypothetical protein